MEKLLHEQLREIDSSRTAFLFKIGNGVGVALDGNDAHAIADEIERTYIPRPRFEDGEPVQFGDATDFSEHVESITFHDTGAFDIHNWDCGCEEYGANTPVKRPAPKVCDADGVEIKVGETVYTEKGDKLTVMEVIPDSDREDPEDGVFCGETVDGFKAHRIANQLTHERPVFDAEGERIRKGDTVWNKNDGAKEQVHDICNDGRVIVSVKDSDCFFENACDLTHREPDSLEKLRDDVDNLLRDCSCDTDTADDIELRFTALIERGA